MQSFTGNSESWQYRVLCNNDSVPAYPVGAICATATFLAAMLAASFTNMRAVAADDTFHHLL
jgi:hypothetical protein